MQTSLFTSGAPTVACVDVPAFPLQLILRAHPDWREDPVVVVAEDRPLAEILWANRAARSRRIRRGMKFAHAQSLVARLHGEVVPPEETAAAGKDLLRLLMDLTPNVEAEENTPGLFWLDPSGLGALYGSLETWARRVHQQIAAQGFVTSVMVGWQRGHLLALARTRSGAVVLPDPETERLSAAPVPLANLNLSPALLAAMAVLNVKTLGDFLALPAAGLRLRYGQEAARLHEIASGEAWTPLRAHRIREPAHAEISVDPPDNNHTRLLFGIKGTLHRLLDELESRSEGVGAIHLTLELDHAPPHTERIEAASPTLDARRLVDLVRLRLDTIRLPAPVERIVMVMESRPVSPRQMECLRAKPKRNLRDAANALARLRAAFGPESVVRARLVDACLPEASFRWETVSELAPSHVDEERDAPTPLVRSLHLQPLRLQDPPPRERESWLGCHGAVVSMSPPGRVRTGWWDTLQDRDYHWVETGTGEILWIFREREGRRWFLHGVVD